MKNIKNGKIIAAGGAVVLVTALTLALTWNQTTSNFQRLTNTLPELVGNTVIQEDLLDSPTLISSTDVGTMTTEEKEGLIQMREEEKLAHDVYVVLGEYWKQQVFTNISKSEQSHTDAVKAILVKYNIEDPYVSEVGKFSSTAMQELYDSLIAEGKKSLADALRVGALIEDLDINDLNVLLTKTTNADIKVVYGNLLRGSRNHIRSFTRVLTTQGLTYTPTYISKELYDQIISGQTETGGVTTDNRGRGQGGRGQSRGRQL